MEENKWGIAGDELGDIPDNREFQFWSYTVSHGTLLLRSPIDAVNDTNIDIVFHGVEYVELPRFLGEVRVSMPSGSDIEHIATKKGRSFSGEVYVIQSDAEAFHVVASAMSIRQNHFDIFEPPMRDVV